MIHEAPKPSCSSMNLMTSRTCTLPCLVIRPMLAPALREGRRTMRKVQSTAWTSFKTVQHRQFLNVLLLRRLVAQDTDNAFCSALAVWLSFLTVAGQCTANLFGWRQDVPLQITTADKATGSPHPDQISCLAKTKQGLNGHGRPLRPQASASGRNIKLLLTKCAQSSELLCDSSLFESG